MAKGLLVQIFFKNPTQPLQENCFAFFNQGWFHELGLSDGRWIPYCTSFFLIQNIGFLIYQKYEICCVRLTMLISHFSKAIQSQATHPNYSRKMSVEVCSSIQDSSVKTIWCSVDQSFLLHIDRTNRSTTVPPVFPSFFGNLLYLISLQLYSAILCNACVLAHCINQK